MAEKNVNINILYILYPSIINFKYILMSFVNFYNLFKINK